ncbi:MAG: 30S ribosomal protein S1, partial [Nitrospinota bacterium]
MEEKLEKQLVSEPEEWDVEDLEALYAHTLSPFREGEILKGKIVKVEKNAVLVDVGYKSEGIIPLEEFPPQEVAVGNEIEVVLEYREDEEGRVVLSRERAERIRRWNELEELYQRGEPVEGVVVSRVKGGLMVDVGVKAFLPASQADLYPVRTLEKLIGQRFVFKIVKFDKGERNIVLSRRLYLEEEREKQKQERLATLEVGQTVEGEITKITDYGAFVDLGGVGGLLHLSNMSWGRVSHPSDLFSVGQRIQVKVLEFNRETERISLGYKQLTPDPWEKVEQKYPEGSVVQARVVDITDYGAFLELEEGIEGLLHLSQMAWQRVKHPSQVVKVGDVIEVMVLSVDKENRRISLGTKQLTPNPWDVVEERYPVGSTVTGKVKAITHFGVFVSLPEGVDGFIHISELSWGKVEHPSAVVKKGEAIEAKVLDIDKEKEHLTLSLKQLTPHPWQAIEQKYPVGSVVEGEVVSLADFGAFVRLEPGVEGLIHLSQLGKPHVSRPEEVVSLGQRVQVEVLRIDAEERKMSLRLVAESTEEREEPPGSEHPT